jgi:hypothetical protein
VEQRAIVIGRDSCAARRPAPERITFWRFKLDNLRSRVGQHFSAVTAGNAGGEVNHEKLFKR